jgi:hypothetical protein
MNRKHSGAYWVLMIAVAAPAAVGFLLLLAGLLAGAGYPK